MFSSSTRGSSRRPCPWRRPRCFSATASFAGCRAGCTGVSGANRGPRPCPDPGPEPPLQRSAAPVSRNVASRRELVCPLELSKSELRRIATTPGCEGRYARDESIFVADDSTSRLPPASASSMARSRPLTPSSTELSAGAPNSRDAQDRAPGREGLEMTRLRLVPADGTTRAPCRAHSSCASRWHRRLPRNRDAPACLLLEPSTLVDRRPRPRCSSSSGSACRRCRGPSRRASGPGRRPRRHRSASEGHVKSGFTPIRAASTPASNYPL